jgi:hypothetical protein
VQYRVAENSSTDERSGTISIAGGSFSIRQRGAEPPRAERVHVDGPVSGLSGSCPSLRMRVGGESVTTDSSTNFERGSCRDLRNGMNVRVRGRRTGSEPIRADEVRLPRDDDDDDDDDSVIGAHVLPEEVLVHPADDVLQPLDAVPRLAGTGELVVLVGKTHHDRRPLEVLERAEQLFAAR